MPPLATRERDHEAEALLNASINEATSAEWRVIHLGSMIHPDEDPDGDDRKNRIEFRQHGSPIVPRVEEWPVVTFDGGNVEVELFEPADREGITETSVDLLKWVIWNVPENPLSAPVGIAEELSPRPRSRHLSAPPTSL
jgi:hypothetical protein